MIRLDRVDSYIRMVRINTRDSLWDIIGSDAGIDANQLREGVSAVDEVVCTVEDYNCYLKYLGRK